MPVKDIAREMGISEATYYNWKAKYGGMEASDVAKMKELERENQRLKAIAPFYGTTPRPLEAVARSCPVVGSYPERDVTAKAGRKLEAALQCHSVPHDIKVYPGARHSFFNDQLPDRYDAAAATDAWERVLRFFAEHVVSRTS